MKDFRFLQGSIVWFMRRWASETMGVNVSPITIQTLPALWSSYLAWTMVFLAGYMQRNFKRWIGNYEMAQSEKVEEMERVKEYLEENLPRDGATTIVHGDFRLDTKKVSLTATFWILNQKISHILESTIWCSIQLKSEWLLCSTGRRQLLEILWLIWALSFFNITFQAERR